MINIQPEEMEPKLTKPAEELVRIMERIMTTNERLLSILETIGAMPILIRTTIKDKK